MVNTPLVRISFAWIGSNSLDTFRIRFQFRPLRDFLPAEGAARAPRWCGGTSHWRPGILPARCGWASANHQVLHTSTFATFYYYYWFFIFLFLKKYCIFCMFFVSIRICQKNEKCQKNLLKKLASITHYTEHLQYWFKPRDHRSQYVQWSISV